MRNRILGALLGISAAIAAPGTANAILVTVDDTSLTVVRPTSGFVDVEFTGHVEFTPGFELNAVSFTTLLYTASGDSLSFSPTPQFALERVLWFQRILSTDPLGLYAFSNDLSTPAIFTFFECEIGGNTNCNSSSINWSVNVVGELPPVGVPEPSTLSLFLVALGSLGLILRRRSRFVVRGANV